MIGWPIEYAGPNGCCYQPTDPPRQAVKEPSMSKQSIASAREKRQRLMEVVAKLGPQATPSQIREQAYRDGFGAVNPRMLIFARNELWPDRPRRTTGLGNKTPAEFILPESVDGLILCHFCKSPDTRVKEVYQRKDGSIKRKRLCRSCGKKFATVGEFVRIHKRRLMARAATEKECSKCHKVLSVSCFGKRANDGDFYRAACRKCLNDYRAGRSLLSSLTRYGVSLEGYEKALIDQKHLCAICKNPETQNRKQYKRRQPLSFDHCHTTGKFRALLCSKCNMGIGNFDDDPDRLEAAARYIRYHNQAGTSRD